MSQKPRISKEDLLACAYKIAVDQGIENVTSRNVANAAGCSVQPVFSHFPTMDSLRQDTYLYACRKCGEELLEKNSDDDFLTGLVHWMIDTARNRPNLFRLLYISDMCCVKSLSESMLHSDLHQRMIERVAEIYHLSRKDSENILVRGCLFLMGIGVSLCTSDIDIEEDKIIAFLRNTIDNLISGIQDAEPKP